MTVKEYRRLGAAAELGNHQDGYMVLNVVEHDGGPYNLPPLVDDENGGILLADTRRPGYAIAIAGDPALLGRLGKALLAIERKAKGGDSDDGE